MDYDTRIDLSNSTDYLISCKEGGSSFGNDTISDYVNLDDSLPVVAEKLSGVRKNTAVVVMNQVM